MCDEKAKGGGNDMKETIIKDLYKDCSALITEKTQEIHRLVLGSGNYDSDIIIVVEAPSAYEEEIGQPFVGKSAQVFNELLMGLNLKREDVYVTHLIKYRPYKVNQKTGRIINRSVKKDEITFFHDYLKDEINIIEPKIIITLGNIPLRTIMEDNSLSIKKEHGKVRKKYIKDVEYRVFPIFHPSAINTKEDNQEDFEVLRTLVEHLSLDHKKKKETSYKIKAKKIKMKSAGLNVQKKPNISAKGTKIIIVYGGNGFANDPTLVAVDRISKVLTELNTQIIRLDLYKDEYNIQDFFDELKYANSVVIATTVEWLGIGGRLQLFLDKCWHYGNQSFFDNVYLFGIVISRQGYERDTYNYLIKSWELLGGQEGSSICANIENSVELETNSALLNTIDKKAEEFYRITHQNRGALPTSIRKNKVLIEVPCGETEPIEKHSPMKDVDQEENINDNPDNNVTLIANYNEYIEKQQKDIEDISNIFKQKLSVKSSEGIKTEPELFKLKFKGTTEPIHYKIQWNIEDKRSKNLVLEIGENKINTYFGNMNDYDIVLYSDYEILQKVVDGNISIQRAFMTGAIKAKGDFTTLYKLDAMFEL